MIRDLSRNLRARSVLSYGQKVDPATGDKLPFVNTHQVHVTADEMVLQDHGSATLRAAPIDVTVDANVLGFDGLDTGTKAPGTWYHIWIVSKATGSAQGLLSLSASNPALPASYTYKAYVGAIYNNSSDCFDVYLQNERLVWAAKTCPLAMTPFPTNPTSVDLSASVPTTAASVVIELSGLTTVGGHYISDVFVGPTSTGPWHDRWMMVAASSGEAGGIDHVQFTTQNEVLLDSPQKIFAYVQSADNRLQIQVLGWRY